MKEKLKYDSNTEHLSLYKDTRTHAHAKSMLAT